MTEYNIDDIMMIGSGDLQVSFTLHTLVKHMQKTEKKGEKF